MKTDKKKKLSNPIQLAIKKRGYRVLLTPTKRGYMDKSWSKNRNRVLEEY